MIFIIQSWILKRKIASSMIILGLVIFGIISLREIPINLLPNIEFPKLTITTTYENASPAEIENLITKPITDAVGVIQGIDRIESESIEGYSFVHLKFKNGTNVNLALMEVREKLDFIREVLPQDAKKPIINRFDPQRSAFMEIVFFPNKLSDEKLLRQFLEDDIAMYLERIDGVASIQIAGGFKKEILIEIDPQRMNSYKVLPNDLTNLVKFNNKNYPAGQLPVGNKDLLIRAMGEFKELEDIRNTVVSFGGESGPIYVSDFSTVSEVYKERTQIARFNGRECVTIYIFKEPGKNSVQISESIQEELTKIQENFGKLIYHDIVYDESVFIKSSIRNLAQNLLIGSILAFLVLVLILRNVRSPTILLIGIPVTLLPTFIVFRYADISFNMMSLGGLALGIGMLFDSSNVVLSAIERNLKKGINLEDSILKGSIEVRKSIISATLTTVIVFFPIIFLKSILGLIFSEMVLSIVITLLMSLVTSLTYLPLVTSIIYKGRRFADISGNKGKDIIESFADIVQNIQSRVILSSKPFLIFIGIAFVLSFLIFPFIKQEFLPKVDSGEFQIQVSLPLGTSLDLLSDHVNNLERSLMKFEEIHKVVSNIGGDESSLLSNPNAITSTNKALIRVILKDEYNSNTSSFINNFQNTLPENNDVELLFDTSNNMLADILEQSSDTLEFLIIGDDLELLELTGIQLKKQIEKFPGIDDIKVGMDEKSKEFKLEYEQLKMSKLKLSHTSVSSFIKVALKGLNISSMKFKNLETEIKLKINSKYVDSLNKVSELRIRTPSGENVSLSYFVKILPSESLSKIMRRGNSRINTFSVKISEDKKYDSSHRDKIENQVMAMKLPEGFKILVSGEKEALNESLKELLTSFLLAALLVYMLLSGQFESYRASFIMILSIPLIFIGIFPALILSQKSLNVSSFMGLVLLAGIVVDNASLYYEYYLLFKEEGKSVLQALSESCRTIVRPLLMNNSTTILGMLPIVLELGSGSEFQSPLGVVVVSGLISASLLTLFIVPIFIYLLEKDK